MIEVFQKLKFIGVKIVVGSGFLYSVVEIIIYILNWFSLVDFVCSVEKVEYGRFYLVMIYFVMKFCGVKDL